VGNRAKAETASVTEASVTADTLASLFRRSSIALGHRVALRRKKYGIWNQITWADSYERVKLFGLGLLASGIQRGDTVGLLGDNEPELYWALMATWCTGGVGCGVWVDVSPSELKYYLQHSRAKFIVARDQEQVDKVLKIAGELPGLTQVIWWNAKGMNAPTYKGQATLTSFDSVVELGRQYGAAHPDAFEEAIQTVRPDDPASIYFTAGTTALPKAVSQSHRSHLESSAMFRRYFPLEAGDDIVCYLDLNLFLDPCVAPRFLAA